MAVTAAVIAPASTARNVGKSSLATAQASGLAPLASTAPTDAPCCRTQRVTAQVSWHGTEAARDIRRTSISQAAAACCPRRAATCSGVAPTAASTSSSSADPCSASASSEGKSPCAAAIVAALGGIAAAAKRP